jgi:glycosyltransferase involved in cell wall biosynthesis
MNIILFGQAPLPIGSNNRNTAPGFRVWHFAQALANNGHTVHLLAVDNTPGTVVVPEFMPLEDNIFLYYFGESQLVQEGTIESILRDVQPEVAVAASIYPSYLASLYLPPEIPFWADLFGSPLAEAQAKAYVYQDDSVIEPFARFEKTVLARADRFSTVSTPQKYALIGELALSGRLTAATYGYQFVNCIPAATDNQLLQHNEVVMRGKIVPEEAFVVLWSGGFNTWTDVDTLFKGLEGAIAQNPKIFFVATGGALPPHDVKTYARFEQLVNNSKHKNQFKLLGWLPLEQVHNYYYEANVGIILDKWSYEGILGSRTRLTEWLKYGLPAISTITAEISEQLAQASGLLTFDHGATDELTRLLLNCAENPEKLKIVAENGRKFVLENYNLSTAFAPLTGWLQKPKPAPDRGTNFAKEKSEQVDGEISAQRKLLEVISHLEEKNLQIAELEKWAKQLEISLKQQSAGDAIKAKERIGNLQARIRSVWRKR